MAYCDSNLLTMGQFCAAMVCKPAEVHRWIEEGMPHHDYKFCLRECQNWHLIGFWMQRAGGDKHKVSPADREAALIKEMFRENGLV